MRFQWLAVDAQNLGNHRRSMAGAIGGRSRRRFPQCFPQLWKSRRPGESGIVARSPGRRVAPQDGSAQDSRSRSGGSSAAGRCAAGRRATSRAATSTRVSSTSSILTRPAASGEPIQRIGATRPQPPGAPSVREFVEPPAPQQAPPAYPPQGPAMRPPMQPPYPPMYPPQPYRPPMAQPPVPMMYNWPR